MSTWVVTLPITTSPELSGKVRSSQPTDSEPTRLPLMYREVPLSGPRNINTPWSQSSGTEAEGILISYCFVLVWITKLKNIRADESPVTLIALGISAFGWRGEFLPKVPCIHPCDYPSLSLPGCVLGCKYSFPILGSVAGFKPHGQGGATVTHLWFPKAGNFVQGC